ncbi:MAG: UDP-N-acetylmuramoyl-tripeptide--D-alanyl-D-alanine ligase, partial [Pseudomonadota bacterium]|nr:UDP-N-acetylmuramoyl-tripeptide--D-alanyl-D-alanine ligase [Pseudomonadota bacterium]
MAALWTAEDAAKATRGANTGLWKATGMSIDTRTLQPGDLFVALRGNALDGHVYAAQALRAGAAAVMVDTLPPDLPPGAPVLKVSDTLKALEDLGRFSRARSAAKIIAVTGSVGKTGTKEMLAAALSACGSAFATQGNLNNHWGAPLSLARMPADVRYAVFELGMNHAGEIGPLSRLVRPHASIITTIEAVHLAHFSGLEAIADAKAEIFEGMEPGGTAILNADNSQSGRLRQAAEKRGLQVISFGQQQGADVCLLSFVPEDTGSTVTVLAGGETLTYRLSLPGQHMALNSLAVLAAVRAAGADVAVAAKALEKLSPVQGRGSRLAVTRPDGTLTIIDDSYNASPAAVKAVLAVLGQVRSGRKVAILGDMLELGEQADVLHARLADAVVAAGVEAVHCCG